jgi:xanthine dehydrogenase accessory factor
MRVLRWAVQTSARYVGMIGSKRKVIAIYKELESEGLSRRLFERVMAPIGLEIGAVTPEEIAVAIVAEMIAVKRNADISVLQKRVAGDQSRIPREPQITS